jgi:hypothetical protein
MAAKRKTKKAHRASRKKSKNMGLDWARAVKDGRVVRFSELRFIAYPTKAMMNAALNRAEPEGQYPYVVSAVDPKI